MKVTGFCRNLVVIEITDMKTMSSRTNEGIESRKVLVTADVIEVVRGNHEGAEFRFFTDKFRIVDEAEAAKSLQPKDLSLIRDGVPYQGSSCQVGRQYLAILPDIREMQVIDFYLEIPKDSEKWRDRIRPLAPKARFQGWGRPTMPTPGDFDEVWHRFYFRADGEGSIIPILMSGGQEMVPAICTAVKDRNMKMRRYAIGALGYFENRKAILALETIYADSTEDPLYRGDALQALFCIDQKLGRLYARAVLKRNYKKGHYLRSVAERVFDKPEQLREHPSS